MARQRMMQKFARWHIWLGWLVGVPILMWTLTGFAMVLKPIEEVRGTDLRRELAAAPLPADTAISIALPAGATKPVKSVGVMMERGEPVTRIAYTDGTNERFAADGREMGALSEVEARLLVGEQIVGGDRVAATTFFAAEDSPFDFRKPMASWRIALADGTHVYVGAESGQIEAVRTRFWRFYDVMWGLHIMDLQTREDTHNPFIITFAVLAALGSLLGCILMFRRRKAKVNTAR